MNTVLARGKERTLLSGNAHLDSGDNYINADHIELYGKDFVYIICTGNIGVKNNKKGIEIWADKLFYNRKENTICFQDNAVMEDKENELVVKGQFIKTWEDDEVTIIQIGVRILKEDMVCRAEYAKYFRKEDRLELSGMPRVIWKGDEYTAMKILVDLKKDEIFLEGNVSGEVYWEEENEEVGDEEVGDEEVGDEEVGDEED